MLKAKMDALEEKLLLGKIIASSKVKNSPQASLAKQGFIALLGWQLLL
jgi:hypothetical protein